MVLGSPFRVMQFSPPDTPEIFGILSGRTYCHPTAGRTETHENYALVQDHREVRYTNIRQSCMSWGSVPSIPKRGEAALRGRFVQIEGNRGILFLGWMRRETLPRNNRKSWPAPASLSVHSPNTAVQAACEALTQDLAERASASSMLRLPSSLSFSIWNPKPPNGSGKNWESAEGSSCRFYFGTMWSAALCGCEPCSISTNPLPPFCSTACVLSICVVNPVFTTLSQRSWKMPFWYF